MYSFIIISIFLLSSCQVSKTEISRRILIQEINEKQSTWSAKENFHENVTLDDLKRLNGALGLHPDPNHQMEIKTHKIAREAIPESFDAREKWSYCKEVIENIRDQGNCGSCWSFAAAEGFTDRLCIQTNGEVVDFQFAPEDLLQCCKDCVPVGADTCGGGYLVIAWEYWTKSGVVSGGDYDSQKGCKPYSSSAFKSNIGPRTCSKSCANTYGISYEYDKRGGVNYYGVPQSVEQIQTEIMSNGPVTTIYEVFEDFYNYDDGVYQHVSGQSAGYHAVKIIGWGTENNVSYWLVANSWGKNWASLNGFFKILRGQNHCEIEANVVTGKSSASVFFAMPVFVMGMIILTFWS